MAYKAKRNFVDRKGKSWKQGEPWTGEDDEAEKEVAAGNIEETEGQQPPPGTGKGGGERGGAPA